MNSQNPSVDLRSGPADGNGTEKPDRSGPRTGATPALALRMKVFAVMVGVNSQEFADTVV